MSTQKLVRSADLPDHVTVRVNNREDFPCSMEQVWGVFKKICFELSVRGRLKVHALVLMANHFHLISSTPTADLDLVMRDLIRSATQSLELFSGRSGHIFRGSYRKYLVDSTRYFAHALKYEYRNPVKAEICDQVEDYPFSTLLGLVGKAPFTVPLYYPFELEGFYQISDGSTPDFLEWLNLPFPKKHDEIIQGSLKKRSIDLARGNWKELFNTLDSSLPQAKVTGSLWYF